MCKNILTCKNVAAGYDEKALWTGLNLSIKKGELVAIAGANGSGKTTLLKILAGLLPQVSGEIKFKEKDLSLWNLSDLSRSRSYMSQAIPSISGWTVYEIVALGLFPFRKHGAMSLSFKHKEKLNKIFETLSLQTFKNRRFDTLSGGEKRRVLFARTLIQSNDIMFLDEPTAFFDPGQSIEFMGTISDVHEEFGSTIIVVTHNINMILNNFQKVLLLGKDGIAGYGNPVEIIESKGEVVFGTELKVESIPGYGFQALFRRKS